MKIIPGFKVCGLILAEIFCWSGFRHQRLRTITFIPHRPNSKTATDIGTLTGSGPDGYSYASGINDAGQVVGYSGTNGGFDHAFITGPDGVGMRDLGSLDGGNSYARGINDAGQVVGYSYLGGGMAARRLPCFHHRPQRDGYEGPWHFGR